VAQDAGGPVSMTPGLHDLRHFYAAGLIVAGCDVVTVQRVHSDIRAPWSRCRRTGFCGRQRRIGRARPAASL